MKAEILIWPRLFLLKRKIGKKHQLVKFKRHRSVASEWRERGSSS